MVMVSGQGIKPALKLNLTLVPESFWLSIEISPPILSRSSLVTKSPMPVPVSPPVPLDDEVM